MEIDFKKEISDVFFKHLGRQEVTDEFTLIMILADFLAGMIALVSDDSRLENDSAHPQKLSIDLIRLLAQLSMVVKDGENMQKERGFRIGWVIREFIMQCDAYEEESDED